MAIIDFINSMTHTIGNVDMTTIKPVHSLVFHPLFDKEWLARIEQVRCCVQEGHLSLQEAADSISGASHLRTQYKFLLNDLKSADLPRAKRVALAEFFHDLLSIKAIDDIYGCKSNIVHTQDEIAAIEHRSFQPGEPKIARILAQLYNAGYHFVNGLYTDFYTDFGVENFGSYALDNERNLLVRHFTDLCPTIIWPELVHSPGKTLTIYLVFKGAKFYCNAISCHSFYEGNPIQSLVSWRVEVDGKNVTEPSRLINLSQQFEKLSAEQWNRLMQLPHEKLKSKMLLMRCYSFKSLFEQANIDWQPDQAMINAITDKPFAMNFWDIPETDQQRYWNRVLDPYNDFRGVTR